MSHPPFHEFRTLLEERVALYVQLVSLTRDQRAAIERGEPEAVLDLLAQRQPIVDALGRCAGKLEQSQPSWEETRLSLSADERDEIDRLVSEADTLAEQIASLDAAHKESLTKHRDGLAGEISRLRQSGRAVSAYGGSTTKGPSFRDENG